MARREFVGQLIAAGPTRTLSGAAGRYTVTAAALRQAVADGLFRGLACFVDHAAGRPSLRRLVGVWQDVRYDEAAAAVVGRLRAYETAATRPVIELLAQTLGESEPPDVGVSLVFYPRLAADGRTVTGLVMVESADLVMFPASVGSRIVGEEEEPHAKIAKSAKDAKEESSLRSLRPWRSWREVSSPGARPTRERAARAGERGGGRVTTVAPWPAGQISHSHDNIADDPGHQLTGYAWNQMNPINQSADGDDGGSQATRVCMETRETVCSTRPPGPKGNRATQRRRPRPAQATLGDLPRPIQGPSLTSPEASARGGRGRRATLHTYPSHECNQTNNMNQLNKESNVYDQMDDQNDGNEREPLALEPARAGGAAVAGPLPRLRLVAAGDEADDTPDGPEPEWAEAWQRSAARSIIRASGLPQPVQERLLGGRYDTVDEIEAAVAGARGELAALNEAGVVRLGGVGGGGRKVQRTSESASHRSHLVVRDGWDEARDLVGFFFGAAGAPEPPPNLRSFADLYVALTGDVHFRGVFDPSRAQFSGATTSTLPNLAVDAMNRVIVQQFEALAHYRWYERVATAEPNDGTLQTMKWITLGGVGNLPTVSEGAAYSELSVADVKETAAFVKRGGYVGITREMIKNSNILQLQAIPRALAAAAVRTRSAAVAALFTASSGVGPTLAQDSKALFHADHGNLATTALGTDAAAWRAARAECFQHTEVGSGKALGIFPRFLLVPAELYDTALSILGYGEGMPSVYTPEAQSRGYADPRPIPLVVPDWTDDNNWAYVVDPAVFPVIQMSYSQAPGGRRHPIPELFAVVSETSGLMFSNDILPIKVRDEFALGVNGPRGIGKRNVA